MGIKMLLNHVRQGGKSVCAVATGVDMHQIIRY